MILTFFISALLCFNSIGTPADSALQEVLNLNEVKSYFAKVPRYSTSEEKSILLLNSAKVNLTDHAEINKRRIQILNSEKIKEKDLIVFIKLNELIIEKANASVNLILQNAILLLEDKQQVEVTAYLNKIDDHWEIKEYDLKRINISY